MTQIPINFPEVNSNVWSRNGYQNHGPFEGPKVDIPSNTLGKITRTEKPHLTMDMYLYVVQWESGQQSKHYVDELFCLGPLTSIDSFEQVVRTLQNAELTQGPSGGFRSFSANVSHDGMVRELYFSNKQKDIYERIVEPIIKEYSLPLKITTIPRKSKK